MLGFDYCTFVYYRIRSAAKQARPAKSCMFKLYVVVAPTPKTQTFEVLSAISEVIVVLLVKRRK